MDKAAKSSKTCELSKSLYESFCKAPDGRLKIRTDRRTVIISKMTLKVCLNSDISDIIYQIFLKFSIYHCSAFYDRVVIRKSRSSLFVGLKKNCVFLIAFYAFF